MERLLAVAGVTRQAVYKHNCKRRDLQAKEMILKNQILQVRREHPRLSCRKIYRILQPSFFGRDKFEAFCFANGLKLYRKRSYHCTTDSRGVTRFENHIAGRELSDVNQVWVSDITYYPIGDRHYYITLIMDQFSRRIVGYTASDSMETEYTTLPALNHAIVNRRPPKGLVFHSDGGGQYFANAFKEITTKHKIINSMGKTAYENPHAERLNGTIKNDYLRFYNPRTLQELRDQLSRAVYNYNLHRPHSSLSELSPYAFELSTNPQEIQKEKRTKKEKVLQQ